jgi:prepilin-type N-terminal cleavage/methylation domain-containing protein
MIPLLQTRARARTSAFTLIELLLVLAVVSILVAVFLFGGMGGKRRSSRISCGSNLRQMGLAFRMWANDMGDRFPMQVTAIEGGTMEPALQGLPVATFASISNELNHPKPLVCPADKERNYATNFEQLTAKNLSYFLGLDASETNPASILAGDRNLRVNGRSRTGFIQINDPTTVTWGPKMHKQPGIQQHYGNIGLGDGSAHEVTDPLLQKQLIATGVATNRFAVP